jgi:hypothetical protein
MAWVVSSTTLATSPPGKTRCPLYRRLGGLQGRSGRVRKITPPPRFDPQTVQPVTSRCNICAIAALYDRNLVLPGVKRVGIGVDHPHSSNAKVTEGEQLYLYFSSLPSRQVME